MGFFLFPTIFIIIVSTSNILILAFLQAAEIKLYTGFWWQIVQENSQFCGELSGIV